MRDHPLEPHWPMAALKADDLWFHNQFPIESYPGANEADVGGHGRMLFLGSYSYLGLNNHPRINAAAKAAVDHYGTGAHGVRLLAGTLRIHHELEARIAAVLGTEAAVVFASGFLTNVSVIAGLISRHDTIVIDRLAHASLVDGCSLSHAKVLRFQHNHMASLEQCLRSAAGPGRRLVIVDGVYSMDGDIADLPRISALCREHGASLMVDEAHSFGVLGRTGRGIEEHFGLPPDTIDIKMGTLSKAIPSVGGYIAGSAKLCEFLSLQARGFIYSAALPAAAAAAALESIRILEEEPDRVARLQQNSSYFAAGLDRLGLSHLNSASAVFPIVCGEDWDAWRMARHCQKHGVFVQAVPHPVVPKGTARLRAAVSATHTREDLDRCLAVLESGADRFPAVRRLRSQL